MDILSAKKQVRSILQSNNMNILPVKNGRMFLQDCGFYLIVIEMVPWYGAGFMLDVGVNFMWTTYYGIVYSYSDGSTRINAGNHPLGAIDFGAADAEFQIRQLMTDAQKKINTYQKLGDFDTFQHEIENRKDFVRLANPGFEKKDVSLAIAQMFSAQTDNAVEILRTASATNEVARELFESSERLDMFSKKLLEMINRCRSAMATKYKIPLPPINHLWQFPPAEP